MQPVSCIILAQLDSYEADRLDNLWLWMGVLIVLLIVMGLGIAILRKTMADTTGQAQSGEPFSLHDLRQMHKDGQISDEQFERAKARILALHTGQPIEDESEDDGITDISHEFIDADTPHNDDSDPEDEPERA